MKHHEETTVFWSLLRCWSKMAQAALVVGLGAYVFTKVACWLLR
jgi:hypothetical protein